MSEDTRVRAAAQAIQEAGPVGCCEITDEKAVELALAALEAAKGLTPKEQFRADYEQVWPQKELTPSKGDNHDR